MVSLVGTAAKVDDRMRMLVDSHDFEQLFGFGTEGSCVLLYTVNENLYGSCGSVVPPVQDINRDVLPAFAS